MGYLVYLSYCFWLTLIFVPFFLRSLFISFKVETLSIPVKKPNKSRRLLNIRSVQHLTLTPPFNRCNFGFFVDGNASLTEQNLTCLGVAGYWYPELYDCYRVEGEVGKEGS